MEELVVVNGRSVFGELDFRTGLLFNAQAGSTYHFALEGEPRRFDLELMVFPLEPEFRLRALPAAGTAFEWLVEGSRRHAVLVEATSDFQTWWPVSTNVNHSGTIRLLEPIEPSVGRFYRGRQF